jgi:hypothetical protein
VKRVDFTTEREGNGIRLKAHTTEAFEWLRSNSYESEEDGLELYLSVDGTSAYLSLNEAGFVVGEVLDCLFEVVAVEPATA